MAIDADEVAQDASAALTSGTEDHLAAMRHSAAHMMAAAVVELFPDVKLGIGPAIRDGFYYDFDLPRPLTPADLEQIEAKMREQQAADLAFEHSQDLPRAEAIARARASAASPSRSRSSTTCPRPRGRPSASTATDRSRTCAAAATSAPPGRWAPSSS